MSNNPTWLQSLNGMDRIEAMRMLDSNKATPGTFGIANTFLKDNSELFGLAGGLLDMWNSGENRDEAKKINDFNMDQARQKLAMTQQAYNNDAWRNKAGSASIQGDDMTGVTDQRQYLGPQSKHPGGYNAATVAPQGLASTSSYKKPRMA